MDDSLADHYDNADFADLELELVVSRPELRNKRKRSTTPSSLDARHVRCHKLVLGIGSPVLKQRLMNWEQQPASSCNSNVQPNLVIQVASEEEAQAVESLVKFFYTKSLPSDASPSQLLQLMTTSNEYQSAQCSEACAR